MRQIVFTSQYKRDLKMAEMVIEENQEIIIQQWHTFFGK